MAMKSLPVMILLACLNALISFSAATSSNPASWTSSEIERTKERLWTIFKNPIKFIKWQKTPNPTKDCGQNCWDGCNDFRWIKYYDIYTCFHRKKNIISVIWTTSALTVTLLAYKRGTNAALGGAETSSQTIFSQHRQKLFALCFMIAWSKKGIILMACNFVFSH